MTSVERRTKALLVEDDPNIVDLIRSNLTVRGFDTCISPDGSRALQLLETEAPDIEPHCVTMFAAAVCDSFEGRAGRFARVSAASTMGS